MNTSDSSKSALMYYDSHAHLDMLTEPAEQVAARALQAGVSKILLISSDPGSLLKVPVLAAQIKQKFATGIHPHSAAEFNAEILSTITHLSKEAAAIGEIGLDYFYFSAQQLSDGEKALQIRVFETQLQLAQGLGMPVVIHSRGAEDDVYSILKNFPGLRGVVHCFTGNTVQAQKIASLGFFIGITGIITFKNAENVRAIVEAIPLSQILIETDSPYLAPIPHRGKTNEPQWVGLVAQKISELKNIPLVVVAQTTYQNALTLFG